MLRAVRTKTRDVIPIFTAHITTARPTEEPSGPLHWRRTVKRMATARRGARSAVGPSTPSSIHRHLEAVRVPGQMQRVCNLSLKDEAMQT